MIILKSDEEIEIMREAGRIRLFYQSVPLAFGSEFFKPCVVRHIRIPEAMS